MTYRELKEALAELSEGQLGMDVTGWSRATGEDSIRVYVVDHAGKILSKANRWTTRLPGWGERTVKIIRFLAKMAIKIKPCDKCKSLLRLNKVKKMGANRGRWFLACPNNCCFEWMNVEKD